MSYEKDLIDVDTDTLRENEKRLKFIRENPDIVDKRIKKLV